MTKHFLSEDIFKAGLRIYLGKNQLKSTEPNDLYESYQEAISKSKVSPLGNLSISDILTTWTSTSGHPLVLVNRNYETGEITFTQKTYRRDNETDDNIWYIPITYMTSENIQEDSRSTSTTFWLTQKTVTLQQKSQGWILVNKEQSGFYRVLYDDENWKRLIQFLHTNNFTMIPPINRAQLIEDALNFANRKYIDYDLALNLTVYLTQETDYFPLKCFARNIAGLDAALKGDTSYDLFKNYTKKIFAGAFNMFDIEEKSEDGHIDKLTRITMAEWMCKYGNFRCQTIGLQSIRSQKFTHISPSLEYYTLCAGIQIASENEWNILLDEYYLSTDKNRKYNYIKALGCSYNATIITKFIDKLFQIDLKISPVDRTAGFQSIMMFSETGLNTTLEYFIHYDHKYDDSIKAAFHESSQLIAIPETHLYQLELLKKAGRIGRLPVRFYLENSISEEGSFSSMFAKWLIKYQEILNLNS